MRMAVACPEPLAAEVAEMVFRKGGNAFDVMVAAAFAQGVVNPQMCGIAGHGGALLYHAKDGRFEYYSFSTLSGSKAFPDVYEVVGPGVRVRDNANLYGYKSIVIPRSLRGIEEIHKNYGSLCWRELIQPAIHLARNGFEVYPYLVSMGFNEGGLSKLTANKACATIYTKNRRPYRVGETLIMRDYAKTLERVADEGADVFYCGEIADIIAKDLEKHGGFVTADDLREEKPAVYEPFIGDYKGLTILGDRPPGRGSFEIEVFNVLEELDFKKMAWNSPEYLDIIARVMIYGLQDRIKFMFDPRHVPGVMENAERLMKKEYAGEIRKRVLARTDVAPMFSPLAGKFTGEDTTYLGVYDMEGNAVSLIHTINASSGIVTPGLGFMYSGHMESFDPIPGRPDSVAPRKTPRTGGLAPMILKNGKPHVIIGTPRGRAAAEIQALLNVIEFRMHPQLAVSAPRLDIRESDPSRGGAEIEFCVESNFPSPYPLKKLEEMLGYKSTISDKPAILACIVVDSETGNVEAGTDPRGGGGLALLA
jgi:gamma-glutamyltranspeptidase/glutathione hydrolase